MRQKLWKRGRLSETLNREITLQDILFLLLLCWIAMPAVFIVIQILLSRLPVVLVGLSAPSSSARVLSGYAKYFYPLGLLSICAAIAGASQALPDPRDLLRTMRQRPWNVCLAFMLFWSVLSTLHTDSPISRFWGLRFHNDGLGSYFIYAAVYVLALLLRDEKRRILLLRLFSFSGVLCSVLIFRQVWAALQVENYNGSAGAAVFLNINHCGYFLTMSILCAGGLWLYETDARYRWLELFSFIVQVYALLLNGTLGCFLAVPAALLLICAFWFVHGRRQIFAPLLLCAIFIGLFLLDWHGLLPGSQNMIHSSLNIMQSDVTTLIETPEAGMQGGSGRIILWVGTLHRILEHPLLGVGPDSLTMPSNGSSMIRTHNEYLQHAMLLGIPALCAYLGAIFTLLIHQWKRLREAESSTLIAAGGLAGYLISSFFGLTLFYTAPFLFLLWGLAAKTPPVEKEETPEAPAHTEAANAPEDAAYTEAANAPEDAALSDAPADAILPDVPDTPGDAPKPRRFSLRTLLAAAAMLFFVGLYAGLTVRLYQEGIWESDDLLKMDIAKELGQQEYDSGADLSEKFWYDAENKTLYSADAKPPQPYGRGTRVNGKVLMTFESAERSYGAEQSYRNCVLMVQAVLDDTAEESPEAGSAESAEGSAEESAAGRLVYDKNAVPMKKPSSDRTRTQAGSSEEGAERPAFHVFTQWVYIYDY